MKNALILALFVFSCASLYAKNSLNLVSPDGKIKVGLTEGNKLGFAVNYDSDELFRIDDISLTTADGEVVGQNPKLSGVKYHSVNRNVASPFYRATEISDRYNDASFNINSNWGVEVRVYNDAVAYRWVYKGKKPVIIKNEGVDFEFDPEAAATAPYVKTRSEDIRRQFWHSYENTYTECSVASLDSNRLIFLPMTVDTKRGVKVGVLESDLDNYPGMYLKGNGTGTLESVFPPYPKNEEQGGHNNLQMIVTEWEDFIAKIDGKRNLPWRIAVVAPDDLTFARTNITYLLAEPSRLEDISWIKPGKVAWDWWNNWNLEGVDFKTGVNNDTYKVYIDFASRNGIEYVILDEGWAVNKRADLMKVVPEIDIKELVDYGAQRGVGIILWAGFQAFNRDMEQVCRHYAEMGVKGFKVDFMDRDDQMMTAFNYRAAATTAKYGLLLDLHGTSKPSGLNRTYPNVLNFEGVNGLEQVKWSPDTLDMMKYDTQIPFLRQMSGPMDYTQGAMRNATKRNYHPCNTEPMSQGTRTHQLALYMIFDSPINMLCDSPSNYDREPECRDFIAGVPTVWDETVVLDGKMGEYVITARRKGGTWWIGAITNWKQRDVEIDLSILGEGQHEAILFTDGVNANRLARDYKRTLQSVDSKMKMKLHLAPGGGAALKITRK